MSPGSLPHLYRQTLRLQKSLNKNTTTAYDPPYFYEPFFKEYLPKFKQRTLRLEGEEYEIFKKKFDSLHRISENKAMVKFTPSEKMMQPKGNIYYYSDLVDQLNGISTPSRKSTLQRFLLKWFRLKV